MSFNERKPNYQCGQKSLKGKTLGLEGLKCVKVARDRMRARTPVCLNPNTKVFNRSNEIIKYRRSHFEQSIFIL